MNARKGKNRQETKDAGILNQLNYSIYALATHLYQYVDILRQSSTVRSK